MAARETRPRKERASQSEEGGHGTVKTITVSERKQEVGRYGLDDLSPSLLSFFHGYLCQKICKEYTKL